MESKSGVVFIVIVSLILMLLGGLNGYAWGFSKGMNKMEEIQKQSECESNYGNKPVAEVPAKCVQFINKF